MKIKKIKDTFNDYQVEVSFGQLTTMRNALAREHSDPLADELFAELSWYLNNIPGPGESEEDLKAEEEAAKSGMESPEAAEQPLKPKADDLLPAPDEGEGEEMPAGPGEEMSGGEEEMPAGPGEEMPPGEEEPPSEEPEADQRIPQPPRE